MENKECDLILVLGLQRYYIDQLKNYDYSEQMQKLETFIQTKHNYLIVINYAFTPYEYNEYGKGLPECIIGTKTTSIPYFVMNRIQSIGHTSICHRKSKDIFSLSNPNLGYVVNDVKKQLKEKFDKVFNKIHIFSLTHDFDDIGLLINGLESYFEKDAKITIY